MNEKTDSGEAFSLAESSRAAFKLYSQEIVLACELA